MEREQPELQNFHLKNLQVLNVSPQGKTSAINMQLTNRSLVKLYLTRPILQECLETFDLFKEIIEDPLQKKKLIRDVMKNIQLNVYDKETLIYNKGDLSESIYLVIKGQAALCMPNIRQTQKEFDPGQQVAYDYQEIDTFQEGVGFGEAQFIHGRKRGLVAIAKKDATVVGCINASSFQEIIELYRQRVYFKKLQMFGNCPLLKELKPHQLQFIVNNAKPITYPISKQIISEKQSPKALYLIMRGQVELRRKQIAKGDNISKLNRKFSKGKLDKAHSKIKIKHVVVGVLEEGCYLGDGEIALRANYAFSAICTSQRVKVYSCDLRIIESQMSQELIQQAGQYYRLKNEYRDEKQKIYRDAKSRIQNILDCSQEVILSISQKKIKRQIMSRYVQKSPTLVGQLSPKQISISIQRKYARIKTSFPQNQLPTEDVQIFSLDKENSYVKKLVRNERAQSPLLRKVKQNKRMYSEPTQKYKTIPIPTYSIIQLPQMGEGSSRCQTKPHILLFKPFHRKVSTLHQRLSKEYKSLREDKQRELQEIKKVKKEHKLSVGEVQRLSQFISKIQHEGRKH